MRQKTEICPPGKCSGCSACRAACPAHAVSMKPDGEGFLHPEIDGAACVGCGRCRAVCPQINAPDAKTPLKVYAAKAVSGDLRLASSSGGIFTLLAEDMLSSGGVVFGAAFCGDAWQVRHVGVESKEELCRLRGSKYVQSEVSGVFGEVRGLLAKGRRVLFSGTPCQIAGLKRYLASAGNPNEELLLAIEVVCHGVPSPLAWRKYLERRIAETKGDRVCGISFRKKNRGWKLFSMSITFASNREYNTAFPDDAFMRGFLAELYNRRSCHDCVCRGLRSEADIVLGDFWRIEKIDNAFDDDKGVSAVLIMSATGATCFERIAAKCNIRESSAEEVAAGNSALARNPKPHEKRSEFFSRVEASDFDELVEELLRPSFAGRLKGFASRCLGRLRNA